MNYNDGFNERNIYIRNSNDLSKLKKNGPSKIDSSFAKMKVEENAHNVETVNNDIKEEYCEARGSKENFIIRNNNMMNANRKVNPNNPVNHALNRNMFKKF